ncbi:MAG: hypothetical protein GKR91_14555 [Pseudomonadales bacterium]|nr:hypothetical protein [Pseudomonadales bacterium]
MAFIGISILAVLIVPSILFNDVLINQSDEISDPIVPSQSSLASLQASTPEQNILQQQSRRRPIFGKSVSDSNKEKILESLEQNMVVVQKLIEEGNFEDGVILLNALYEEADRLSTEDKIILYNIYAKLLHELEMNTDAILVYEELISLSEVPDNIKLDALKELGELYNKEAMYENGQFVFERWIAESDYNDTNVFKGLSISFYRQGQHAKALGPAIEHVRTVQDRIEDVDRDTLVYLNGLAFSTENWVDAEWITKLMIEQFDTPVDWRNLIAIYDRMGNEDAKNRAFDAAVAAGMIDKDGNLIR